jgi:hypothetical protein
MGRLVAACTLAFLAGSAPGVLAQEPSSSKLTLSGVVVDARSQLGLANVGVRAFKAGDGESASPVGVSSESSGGLQTTTDGTGQFRLVSVAPGRYRLVVQLEGFLPFEYPDDVVAASDERVRLVIAYTLRISAEVQATAVVAEGAELPTAAAASALSGRAIATMPGGLEDVMRAFQSRPGVAASQDDRNDMLVRGGGAIENAIRIDGFDVPTASHFWAQGGTGGGLSFVPPALIDRAVLQTGGFSVQFGERASSALDLTLKTSARDRVHGQAGASVGGIMGQAAGTMDDGRGTWLVSGRRSFVELVFDRGGDRAVPHYSDFVGRLDFALGGRHRLELLTVGAWDDVILEASDGTGDLHDNQSTALVGASLRSDWTPRWTSALYASCSRAFIDAILNGVNQVDGSDRSTEVEWRVRGEAYRKVGADGQFMAGAAAKHADLAFDLHADSFRNDYNALVPAFDAVFPYTFTDSAVYVEMRVPSIGGLQATPGVRADRSGTTGRWFASPRVNFTYPVNGRVQARGAWGIYQQSIPYIWIGSDVRNARLDPVRSAQAALGLSMRLPAAILVSIDAFDKRYSGYPVDVSEPWRVLVSASAEYESPFVGLLSDQGRVRARGVDTSVGTRFWRRLEMAVSYSYWHVEQAGIPAAGYGSWLPGDYDIRHQFRLDATYEAGGKWQAGAQFRYASGRPYTPYDTRLSIKRGWGYYDRTNLNAETYPAYHRLDVRVERRFGVGRTMLAVYGEIDNVYDHDNVYIYEWARATKQAKAVYQWGRQPIGGVRWEF